MRTIGVDIEVRRILVDVHKGECANGSFLLTETEIEFVACYTVITDCADFGIGLHECNTSVNVEVADSNVVIFNEEDIEVVLEVVQSSIGVDSPATTLSNGVSEGETRECAGYIIDVVDRGAIVCNMP